MAANKPLVVFRADGHSEMGLGHLYRSSALADMIRSRFTIALAYRHCPPKTLLEFNKVFDHFIDLSKIHEVGESEYLIKSGKELAGWNVFFSVVLDGYHFGVDYQESIRRAGCPLVCIDDIFHQPYVADVIINHAGGVTPKHYTASTFTKFYLGPKYALLRSAFRSAYKRELHVGEAGLFICLGGADPPNATLSVLHRCFKAFPNADYDVVIGNANPHRSELETWIARTGANVRLHIGLGEEEMAELMKTSAVGITSPSTVSFEYLSVGGVLYLQPIVDNQASIYRYYTETKLAFSFENDFPLLDPGLIAQSLALRETIFDGQIQNRYLELFSALQSVKT